MKENKSVTREDLINKAKIQLQRLLGKFAKKGKTYDGFFLSRGNVNFSLNYQTKCDALSKIMLENLVDSSEDARKRLCKAAMVIKLLEILENAESYDNALRDINTFLDSDGNTFLKNFFLQFSNSEDSQCSRSRNPYDKKVMAVRSILQEKRGFLASKSYKLLVTVIPKPGVVSTDNTRKFTLEDKSITASLTAPQVLETKAATTSSKKSLSAQLQEQQKKLKPEVENKDKKPAPKPQPAPFVSSGTVWNVTARLFGRGPRLTTKSRPRQNPSQQHKGPQVPVKQSEICNIQRRLRRPDDSRVPRQ